VIAAYPEARVWHRLALVWFLVTVFAPLLALLAAGVQNGGGGQTSWLSLAIPWGRRGVLLLRSVTLAGAVAAAALVWGFLAATVLWRWQTGRKAWLRWLLLALAPVPPYVHALAWSAAAGGANHALQSLVGVSLAGSAFLSSWWVQVMAFLPLATGLCLVGLESVDMTLIEAGRVLQDDRGILFRVIIPLAGPMLLTAFGLLFLLSLVDYSVPSLFGLNVYALEIFAEYSASHAPRLALALALPVLIITVLVVLASQAAARQAAQPPPWRHRPWSAPPGWPSWLQGMQGAAALILLLSIAVPAVTLVAVVGSWENLAANLAAARSEISFSLWQSLVTAVVCLPGAAAVGQELSRPGAAGRLWWLLATLPLAIPAPLVGIGLISLSHLPLGESLAGTRLVVVWATLARFTPLAALIMLAQWRRVDPVLLDAARLLPSTPARTWWQIKLPLLAPGFMAALCLVFALSLGELGAVLMVAPPGAATLTMRIYNYLHYGAADTVAGLCLMMALGALMAGVLAVAALALWSRLLPSTASPPPEEAA
jgi:iron(III) transport system permease protein